MPRHQFARGQIPNPPDIDHLFGHDCVHDEARTQAWSLEQNDRCLTPGTCRSRFTVRTKHPEAVINHRRHISYRAMSCIT